MKAILLAFTAGVCCTQAPPEKRSYVGSTPAHEVVREFLGIPLTDSVDFIRWHVGVGSGSFDLQCQYGISKPSTPGFLNEKRVVLNGAGRKGQNRYVLESNGKVLSLLEVNPDVLHFLDSDGNMLVGNGGYSYALNSTTPVRTDQFNIASVPGSFKYPLDFEGRTPCQELSALLGLNKSAACDKMKWHIIFCTDSMTGKPSYFLMGGTGYRKETMEKGTWQVIRGKDARIIYEVNVERQANPVYLLKGDDNILFFIDAKGQLLVGNENFS